MTRTPTLGLLVTKITRTVSQSLLNRSKAVAFVVVSAGTFGLVAPAPAATPVPLRHQTHSDTIDLVGLESQFRRVAEAVTPSVVAITSTSDALPSDTAWRSEELTAEGLDELLRHRGRTVGTGFAIHTDGYILTNEHVVADAKHLWVTTDTGRVFPAIVVGSDPRSDLAVIKIPGSLPAVEFAKPGTVRRGQWTIAIGNPVGLSGRGEMCMSVGIVSATGRSLPKLSDREGRLYADLIQTTAEVNPGNSGGPLFDISGRVVGIVTAVVLPHKTTNGLGFAMPADQTLLDAVTRLCHGQPLTHAFLGVAVSSLPGSQNGQGVLVHKVGQDTPAAGLLQEGDVILSVEGRSVADEESFVRMVGAAPVDQPVSLAVRRNGSERSVQVQLTARGDVQPGISFPQQQMRWRGVTFAPAVGDGVAGGVRVLNIEPDSPLTNEGLTVGSLVRAVAGRPVRDLIDLQLALDATPAAQARLDVTPAQGVQTASVME